jgi:hypothetical protein
MDPEKKEPDADETIFDDVDLTKKPDIYIHRARLLLFCIAGVTVYGLITSLPNFKILSLLPIIFFTGTGIWAKYNPMVALSVALIVWVGINIYAVQTDRDANYFSAIMLMLINLLVVALLGLGIREAWQLKKHDKTG